MTDVGSGHGRVDQGSASRVVDTADRSPGTRPRCPHEFDTRGRCVLCGKLDDQHYVDADPEAVAAGPTCDRCGCAAELVGRCKTCRGRFCRRCLGYVSPDEVCETCLSREEQQERATDIF